MNSMSEYSKNTAANANNTHDTAVASELESPFLAPEALGSEQVVQAADMGLDIAAEPLSFDEPGNPSTQLLANPIQPKQSGNWWSRQSLKAKATLAAILIGTMPVAVTGAAAWLVANQAVTTQVEKEEMATAEDLQDKVNLFMRSRAQDIQVIAARTIFTDAKRRSESTAQEKGQVLDEMLQAYGGAYASIAAFDLNGNVMAQTQGDTLENQSNELYFQAALKSEAPVVGFPTISAAAGDFSVYAATTIKDSVTGKPVGVIRGRIPVAQLDSAIRNYAEEGSIAYYLVDTEGKAFLTSPGAVQITEEKPILPILEVFPGLESLRSAAKVDAAVLEHGQFGTEQYLAYVPPTPETDPLNLGWSIVLATPTEVAFASQRQLGLTLILGTLVAGAGVAALATYLAGRATKPVLLASEAVQKLGQGDLETRIEVNGTDEMAVLGSNINLMAGQIQNLLVEQEKASQEQLAAQAEIAAQQVKAAQEQLEAKEFLQNRALELLMEVSPLRNGDLTIRANVTEDEIGTIADSYNATILSLRKLVTQVQDAAKQVAATADQSEGSVQELSADALQQANSIQVALERITEMTTAIQSVTRNAKTAEMVVQAASQSVLEGDQAMNKTVEGILAIRETVAETSKKVKQLGESSQKISKVVNLISSFADQTNLLALNASIEAARAGEEGRGFAVVADEVRSLARQSAKATADIEALVADIQTETNEVVMAMETGTQQVVTGTQLVEETRQRLTQITEASETITALVQSIAQAAIQQSQASEQVSATMTDVAGIATNTSGRAGQVLTAFQDLLNVAQDLQGTVGQFKLQ